MSLNGSFELPEETEEARVARLREIAAKRVARETDEELIDRFVAEARAKRVSSASEPQGSLDAHGFPMDYDRVEIFKGQNKNDQSYVPLGIKGFVLKVPRGEEVIIPSCFTEVLEHAVEEVTIQSQGGLVTRPALRFPFTKRGKATRDEYLVFRTEQRRRIEMQQGAQTPA